MFVMDHKPFQASLDVARAEFAQIQRSQLQDQQLAEIVAPYKALGYGWTPPAQAKANPDPAGPAMPASAKAGQS